MGYSLKDLHSNCRRVHLRGSANDLPADRWRSDHDDAVVFLDVTPRFYADLFGSKPIY
jgi:hypothetical protein